MGCEACKLVQKEGQQLAAAPVAASTDTSGIVVADVQTSKFLSKVKLFKRLPDDKKPLLAQCCVEVHFNPGEKVINQGDEGDNFFVIKAGSAKVVIDGAQVATLKAGDYFGECALLRSEPRNATVIAQTALGALRITRDKFRSLELHKDLRFPRRKAVGQGEGVHRGCDGTRAVIRPDKAGLATASPKRPKSCEERMLIERAIRSNAHLQNFICMDDACLREMVDAAEKTVVTTKTEVITEGSLDADYFYIVQEGSFQVVLRQAGEEAQSLEDCTEPVNAPKIGKGGSFGELALLFLAPRAATIVALEDSLLWTISRRDFKQVLAKASEDTISKFMPIFDKVGVLAALGEEQRHAVARALVEMTFSQDENILEQGEVGDSFYILAEGEVQVLKDGKEEARLASTSSNFQTFGERALLNDEPRAATVKVVSVIAKAFVMDRESFRLLLLPLDEMKVKQPDRSSNNPSSKQTAPQDFHKSGDAGARVRRSELMAIGLLGCGGFGVVELVEHQGSGRTFALKSLSKGYIVKLSMQHKVIHERDIQLMCDSPFVIKLYETYNEPSHLLLLLELAQGGDLYGTYIRESLHGSEPHASFYAAGVICAFAHMHKKRIVYRDLKPENCLLTLRGLLKVTDMGLAKVLVGKTFTTCGTPDYFAPEIIASKGYQLGVDWWAVGIFVFELMAGHAPFTASAPMQIFEKVTAGITKVKFPREISPCLQDLVKALCKQEPSLRLPMKKGGVKNLKQHAWYKGFNWVSFENLELPGPYVPRVKGAKDISNFAATSEDKPPQVPYKDDGSGWDVAFATQS